MSLHMDEFSFENSSFENEDVFDVNSFVKQMFSFIFRNAFWQNSYTVIHAWLLQNNNPTVTDIHGLTTDSYLAKNYVQPLQCVAHQKESSV